MEVHPGTAGARIIIDDVFLGGAASQQRWQQALAGPAALWVGVRCDGAVACPPDRPEHERGQVSPGSASLRWQRLIAGASSLLTEPRRGQGQLNRTEQRGHRYTARCRSGAGVRRRSA
ncbi:phosphotransferase-like protein [Actinoallomurus acanthiterrae]